MASPQPQAFGYLSWWAKAFYVTLLPVLLVNFIRRFTFLSATGSLHWRQRVALAFLQAEYATFTTQQRHASARRQLTGPAIEQYCRTQTLPYRKVYLNDAPSTVSKHDCAYEVPRPSLHFVTPHGAPSSGPIFFYSHGGAYTKPMRAGGHMPFVLHCATACKASQAVLLEYSLAPEHPYPVQLVQIVTALNHLLGGMSIKPSDIILAGDSAGGHLTASLLAHLVRPSPYAPPVHLQGEQLRAVLLVSPFVVFDTDHASFESNVATDYLDAKGCDALLGHWKPKYDDVWANICDERGSQEVWARVFSGGEDGRASMVKRVLVTAGTGEVLLDGIRRFATEFVQAEVIVADRDIDVGVLRETNFAMVEAIGEAHVQPALDSFLGYYQGNMTRAIVAFLEFV